MRAASGRLSAVPELVEAETCLPDKLQSEYTRLVQHGQEVPVCERCFGAGIEVVVGKGARRCACRQRDLRCGLFEQARVPRRYEECTLSNYQPAADNASQLLAFKQAYRLVREYPAIERGLLFVGPVGVGKTHLSVAILRGLAAQGTTGLF